MPIDPTLGSSLIGGAVDLISGLFGMSKTDKINKANLQMTRETNHANRDIAAMNNANMLEQQSRKMQFDLDMWNKQNDYNSPAAQKARLQEAGYNPYMQDMPAGNATSSPTMETYTPDSAQIQPYIQDPNAYDNSIMMMANATAQALQLYQQGLQAQQMNTANKYQELMLLKQLKSMDLDISNKELSNAAQVLMNDFNRDTYKNRVEMLKSELTQKTLSNSLLQKQLDFLPKQQQMEVARFTADLATIGINNNMTKAQLRNVALQSGQISVITQGLKLDNKQKERTIDYAVRQAYWEMNMAKMDAFLKQKQNKTEYWRGIHEKNNSGPDNWWQNTYKLGKGGSIYRGLGTTTGVIGNIFGSFVK